MMVRDSDLLFLGHAVCTSLTAS